MKALSIKQPWVWAILNAGKDIENRSWKTSFRGSIALHASAKPNREARLPRGIRCPDFGTLDTSSICGVALVVDITTKSRSKWFYHPDDDHTNYGWVLADVTPLVAPIPCNGALNLWNVPPEIQRAIERQIPQLKIDTR
jgi:hypothetical protein